MLQQLQEGPIERAQKLGITPFEGSVDPAEALSWLDTVESIYKYMHLTAQEKLECTIFMLRGPAKHWWKTVQGRYGAQHTDHLGQLRERLPEQVCF